MVCASMVALMSLLIAVPSDTIAERINGVFGTGEGPLPERKSQLREIVDQIKIPLESLSLSDLTAVATALEALEEYRRCYDCCKLLSVREPDSSIHWIRMLRTGLQVESAAVLEKEFSRWDAKSNPLAEANGGFFIVSYAYLKSNDCPSAWRMVEDYCDYIVRLFDFNRPQSLKLATGVIPYCSILATAGGGVANDVEALSVLYDRVGGEITHLGNDLLADENGHVFLALQRDCGGLLHPEQRLTLICRQLESIAAFKNSEAVRRSKAFAQAIHSLMANSAALGTGNEDLEFIQKVVRNNEAFTDADRASLQPRLKAADLLKSRVREESAARPAGWLIVVNNQTEVSSLYRRIDKSPSALPGMRILVDDRSDITTFREGVEILDLNSPEMSRKGSADARKVSEELSRPLFLWINEEGLVKAVCLSHPEAITTAKRMVPRMAEQTPRPD